MFSTDKLIELVKKHKILYDFLHVDYKNVKARDEVWVEIGKELNESGKSLFVIEVY